MFHEVIFIDSLRNPYKVIHSDHELKSKPNLTPSDSAQRTILVWNRKNSPKDFAF